MSYASTNDVKVSLGRPLSDDEDTQADALLDRVELRISSRIPTLEARLIAEDSLLDLLVEVEADVVARKIDNPSGYLQEQDGDYMYTRDRALLKSGGLALTDDEWSRLGVTKGAFTIGAIYGARVRRGPDVLSGRRPRLGERLRHEPARHWPRSRPRLRGG